MGVVQSCSQDQDSDSLRMVGGKDRPVLKLKDMEEKHLHNLFLKNMSGLIEEVKNPTPRLNQNFFPNAFDYKALKTDSPRDRLKNYEVAFMTGEKFAGVPDFLTAEDMSGMVEEQRIDPKMIFSYVQEVY